VCVCVCVFGVCVCGCCVSVCVCECECVCVCVRLENCVRSRTGKVGVQSVKCLSGPLLVYRAYTAAATEC
jgi:hypothetical protein